MREKISCHLSPTEENKHVTYSVGLHSDACGRESQHLDATGPGFDHFGELIKKYTHPLRH